MIAAFSRYRLKTPELDCWSRPIPDGTEWTVGNAGRSPGRWHLLEAETGFRSGSPPRALDGEPRPEWMPPRSLRGVRVKSITPPVQATRAQNIRLWHGPSGGEDRHRTAPASLTRSLDCNIFQ